MKNLKIVTVGNCLVLNCTQTPSPKIVKHGPKTPLFPATDVPDLLTFLTPATPGQEDACTATKKYTRYSVHAYHMVRLHVLPLHFVVLISHTLGPSSSEKRPSKFDLALNY